MSDQYTLIRLFFHYRTNLGLGLASAIMCMLRHIQLKSDWRATFTSACMCGLLAFGIDEGLTKIFGLGGTSSYIVAVLIGYIGVESILSRLDFLRKKEDETHGN